MSLSSDFHDNKTSSDLTQAVNGGRSVSDLLETVCFQVVPMFIDLAVAFAYLWSLFGPYMGLMMATTVTSYLYITTKLIAKRADKRREYITIYRKEWTIGHQSLDGWSTASVIIPFLRNHNGRLISEQLFNMIPYERHRYACGKISSLRSQFGYTNSTTSRQRSHEVQTNIRNVFAGNRRSPGPGNDSRIAWSALAWCLSSLTKAAVRRKVHDSACVLGTVTE